MSISLLLPTVGALGDEVLVSAVVEKSITANKQLNAALNLRRTKMFRLETFNTRIYLAIGVSILFVLLSVPGILTADHLKFFSNISLSFGAAVFAYGEWVKNNNVAVSNAVKSILMFAAVILVSLCVYLLATRYM